MINPESTYFENRMPFIAPNQRPNEYNVEFCWWGKGVMITQFGKLELGECGISKPDNRLPMLVSAMAPSPAATGTATTRTTMTGMEIW